MSDIDAMLAHSRKRLNQRAKKPIAKHADETWKAPIADPQRWIDLKAANDEIARLQHDLAEYMRIANAEAQGHTQALERVKQLREALSACQTVAIMRGDQFLCDCIDNTGRRYQSAWLAALLEKS